MLNYKKQNYNYNLLKALAMMARMYLPRKPLIPGRNFPFCNLW